MLALICFFYFGNKFEITFDGARLEIGIIFGRNCTLTKEELKEDKESFKQKYLDVLSRVGEALDVDTEDGQRVDVVDVFVSTVNKMS